MYRHFIILWLLALPFSVRAQDFKTGELPALERVVFYSSGVAHMQHRGTVTDKTQLTIRFGGHDIDDVLKSLVFEDRSGGFVRAVEYKPAPNPEDVAANDFQPMTLAQLLQKYRGEEVSFMINNEQLKGKVFGVENRPRENGVGEALITIDEEGAMQSMWLDEILQVRFTNEEVRKEMSLAMLGVTKSRKANQKTLDLLFDGEGEREVGFGYVVDAPIWRMTYRLEVKPQQVQLQGWTHINNVTGVDWAGVNVELRTGQPQSFHAELFAPVLAERESVGLDPFGLPEALTLVRQFYGFDPAPRYAEDSGGYGGMGGGMGGMGGGMMGGGMGGGYGGTGGTFGGRKSDKAKPKERGIDSDTAFQKLAQLNRTGSIVRFQLDKPVDLPSGKSAALPVFKQNLPSRLLSVVKHLEDGDDLTAIKAIELTNATRFALVAGPVSVSRDGDFVGDTRIERLPIDEKAMLPYSVDRAVEVTRQQSPSQRTERVRFANNQFRETFDYRQDVQFLINNEDKDPRLMIIEYELPLLGNSNGDAEYDPFDSDGETSIASDGSKKLSVEPVPTKRDGQLLTYELPAKALDETKLTLQLSWSETNNIRVRNVSGTQARKWLARKDLDDATRKKLEQVVAFAARVLASNVKMAQLREQRTKFVGEQSRARQNISALEGNAQAAAIYVTRLSELETAIRKVDAELETAQLKQKQLERERSSL